MFKEYQEKFGREPYQSLSSFLNKLETCQSKSIESQKENALSPSPQLTRMEISNISIQEQKAQNPKLELALTS